MCSWNEWSNDGHPGSLVDRFLQTHKIDVCTGNVCVCGCDEHVSCHQQYVIWAELCIGRFQYYHLHLAKFMLIAGNHAYPSWGVVGVFCCQGQFPRITFDGWFIDFDLWSQKLPRIFLTKIWSTRCVLGLTCTHMGVVLKECWVAPSNFLIQACVQQYTNQKYIEFWTSYIIVWVRFGAIKQEIKTWSQSQIWCLKSSLLYVNLSETLYLSRKHANHHPPRTFILL